MLISNGTMVLYSIKGQADICFRSLNQNGRHAHMVHVIRNMFK